MVLDLAKAFERIRLRVVWAWATHLSFARQIFTGALRLLQGADAVDADVFLYRDSSIATFA